MRKPEPLRPTHKATLFKKLLTLPPENPFWDNGYRFSRPVFTQEAFDHKLCVTQVKPVNTTDEEFNFIRGVSAMKFFVWFDAQPGRFQKDIVKLSKGVGCKYI
jgi:hypothetical protein